MDTNVRPDFGYWSFKPLDFQLKQYFKGANYDKNAAHNISDKDDLHNQCSNVADSSPLGQKLGSSFPNTSKRALTRNI